MSFTKVFITVSSVDLSYNPVVGTRSLVRIAPLQVMNPHGFSRSISPFSFIGFIPYIVEDSLAGAGLDGSENSQLSSLRQDFIPRYLERAEFFEPSNDQMPSMWQSEAV